MNVDDVLKALIGEGTSDSDIYFVKYLLPTDNMFLWAQISIEMILGGEY